MDKTRVDGVPVVLRIHDRRSGTVEEIFSRDARMCPRYARVNSSIPPVILRLASNAVSIFAKRSFANESALYRAKPERVPQFSLEIRKNETMDGVFVTATRLFRNLLRGEQAVGRGVASASQRLA